MKPTVIFVDGSGCVGKTTFINNLSRMLADMNIENVVVGPTNAEFTWWRWGADIDGSDFEKGFRSSLEYGRMAEGVTEVTHQARTKLFQVDGNAPMHHIQRANILKETHLAISAMVKEFTTNQGPSAPVLIVDRSIGSFRAYNLVCGTNELLSICNITRDEKENSEAKQAIHHLRETTVEITRAFEDSIADKNIQALYVCLIDSDPSGLSPKRKEALLRKNEKAYDRDFAMQITANEVFRGLRHDPRRHPTMIIRDLINSNQAERKDIKLAHELIAHIQAAKGL